MLYERSFIISFLVFHSMTDHVFVNICGSLGCDYTDEIVVDLQHCNTNLVPSSVATCKLCGLYLGFFEFSTLYFQLHNIVTHSSQQRRLLLWDNIIQCLCSVLFCDFFSEKNNKVLRACLMDLCKLCKLLTSFNWLLTIIV